MLKITCCEIETIKTEFISQNNYQMNHYIKHKGTKLPLHQLDYSKQK